MTKKLLLIIIVLILILGGAAYYFFIYQGQPVPLVNNGTNPSGYSPLNSSTPISQSGNSTSTGATAANNGQQIPQKPVYNLPKFRQLSTTPVGGFMASSTASSSLAIYVDRGLGHIFETQSIFANAQELSNTTLPQIYESYWNKKGDTAILRYLHAGSDTITNFSAVLLPTSTNVKTGTSTISTVASTSTTPFQVKGNFAFSNALAFAVSPKGDQVFTLYKENSDGTGYVSNFDGTKQVKILDTPLTQLNVAWPEQNTIALTTKPSGISAGYLYFVSVKNALFQKILGGINGLDTLVSPDAKRVLLSSTNSAGGIQTSIFTISDGTTKSVIFNTLADKCVWSKLNPDEAFCAVPQQPPAGIYPDDWYKGTASFADQIWHIDTSTGSVQLVGDPLASINTLIDAENLTLDPQENYLYFVNKRDLTLWSLKIN